MLDTATDNDPPEDIAYTRGAALKLLSHRYPSGLTIETLSPTTHLFPNGVLCTVCF